MIFIRVEFCKCNYCLFQFGGYMGPGPMGPGGPMMGGPPGPPPPDYQEREPIKCKNCTLFPPPPGKVILDLVYIIIGYWYLTEPEHFHWVIFMHFTNIPIEG
jgi:hypothetical protein